MPTVPSPVPVFTVTVRIAPVPDTPVIEAPVTPVVTRSKAAVETPLTNSLNTTVKSTVAPFFGLASVQVRESIRGEVLSIVYTVPAVNGTLLRFRLPEQATLLELSRFSRRVPLPVPVLTTTVRVVPEPVTRSTDAPEMPPVAVKLKWPGVRPLSELVVWPPMPLSKVTVNTTEAARVGLVSPVRGAIETTAGAGLLFHS